ncbi:MAG: GNAT family N-acetyltransferase [Pseudomonadota bacterium]
MRYFAHHDGAGWSLRPFEERDFRQVHAIFRTCFAAFPWRGRYRLSNSSDLGRAIGAHTTWVAEEPYAGIVGFMIFEPRTGYVSHVFIDQDWRLCGISTAFLKAARQKVGHALSLDVDERNRTARRAYAALGWKVAAKTPHPRNSDQIRLIGP